MEAAAGFVLTNGDSTRMRNDNQRRTPAEVELFIELKRFKMHYLSKPLQARSPLSDAAMLENMNTSLEWGSR